MDENLHEDLSSVMEDNHDIIVDKYPPDSFMAIFWRQQKRAMHLKNAKSMKWEAAMIRSVSLSVYNGGGFLFKCIMMVLS